MIYAALIVGMVLIAAGVGWESPAAGVVVLGIELVLFALLADDGRPDAAD